jgi:hypothetical protein
MTSYGSKIAMAESRDRLLLTVFLTGLAVGCAGSPEPVTRTPKSEPPPPAPSSPAPQSPAGQEARKSVPPQEIPAAGSGPKKDDPNVVVVDPGDAEDGPATLAEAARTERERRAKAGPPVAVITNKSLSGYARKGQITISDSKEKNGAADRTAAPPATAEPVRDEQYWRNRALEIRKRWREVADEVQELEKSAAALRQRFYGEDDPYVRDSQIKPEWDRTLDRLRQARVEVETTRRELGDFLEEGRVAGVMDGWLREGIDLEPEEEEKPAKASSPAQSIEPPVADEPPVDEGGGEA